MNLLLRAIPYPLTLWPHPAAGSWSTRHARSMDLCRLLPALPRPESGVDGRMPIGIADRSVLHSSGWEAANALMAVIQLAGLLLVLALTRPWARRVPAWLTLFPLWVATGLLFQVVVGVVLFALFSPLSQTSNGSTGPFQPWVFVMVYAGFAGQAAALAIAIGCYVRIRWGQLLGERTGEVVARRRARVRSWPENRLAEMAEILAGMALAVALV